MVHTHNPSTLLGRLRQENYEFKASRGYMAGSKAILVYTAALSYDGDGGLTCGYQSCSVLSQNLWKLEQYLVGSDQ